jgi:hypothetical protein
MYKKSLIITQFSTHESPTHITPSVMGAISLILAHNTFIRKVTSNYRQTVLEKRNFTDSTHYNWSVIIL